jgi:hypothetical protein
MPIEIKNLFISANVYDGKKKDAAVAPAEDNLSHNGALMDEQMKLHIIDQAVQQVLFILERQKDR